MSLLFTKEDVEKLSVEEMHRYHINTYKNFRWNDYMYEGMELGIDLKK